MSERDNSTPSPVPQGIREAAEAYVAENGFEHSGGIIESAFEAGAWWSFQGNSTPYGYVFGGCTFLRSSSPLVTDHVKNNSLPVFLNPCGCSSHDSAVEWRIKQLEWVDGAPGTYKEVADSPFGNYSVWEINGTACWSPWKDGAGSIVDGGIVGAKAAAQADYETRIRAALATATSEDQP